MKRFTVRVHEYSVGFVATLVVVALLTTAGVIRHALWLGSLLAVLVAALSARFADRGRMAGRAASAANAQFERLVALCYNDRALAERLVAGEEQRHPGSSRRALIERAIERLADDRRR